MPIGLQNFVTVPLASTVQNFAHFYIFSTHFASCNNLGIYPNNSYVARVKDFKTGIQLKLPSDFKNHENVFPVVLFTVDSAGVTNNRDIEIGRIGCSSSSVTENTQSTSCNAV